MPPSLIEEAVALGGAGLGLFLTTNLDNLVICTAAIGGGAVSLARARWALLGAAATVLVASLLVARLAAAVPGPETRLPALRWIGLLPLGLGVRALWAPTAQSAPAATAGVGLFLVLLANSTDTFGALAPLMVETAPPLRLALASGLALGAAGLPALVAALLRSPALRGVLDRHGARIGGVTMVLIGLYILVDSPTDGV